MNQPRDLPGLDEVKQLLAEEIVNADSGDDAFVFLVEGEQTLKLKTSRRRSILMRLARKVGGL
jgi:hypothetical protein